MKIRTKLSYQFILITIGIYGLSMLFIYRQFKAHIEEEIYSLLESKARMTAEMVLFHEDELQPLPDKKEPGEILILDVGNTSIYNNNLNRIYSLISSAPNTPVQALMQIRESGDYRFINPPYKAFGFLYKSRQNMDYIVVSEDKPDYSKLVQLRNILLISTLFTVLIVAFGGWFFAGQSLRPVSRIIHEVKHILPTDLSKRLKPDKHNDELTNLITTFNSLLERIDQAFRTEKSFISNVSHELRNPLAAIRTQIQYAINKKRTPEEYNHILSSLQEDIDEMTQTIEKLLQLARVNSNANHIPLTAVRLDELIYQAQESLYKSNPSYNIKIEMLNLPVEEEGMLVRANEPLLKLALMNLMENGCKFSNDSSTRTTLDFSNPDEIRLEFQNFGAAISPDEITKIFQPFYRTTEHKHRKGSGIGLSLVKSILDIHKIPLEVFSDKEQGNRFILRFRHTPVDTYLPEEIIPKPSTQLVQGLSPLVILLVFVTGLVGCASDSNGLKSDKMTSKVIQDWYSHFLVLNRYTDGYRPPVSARTFGYIGIAGWEAGTPKFGNALSLNEQIHHVEIQPFDPKQPYHLEASLNALYFSLASLFYPSTNRLLKSESRNLYESNLANFEEYADTGVLFPSDRYGKYIASQIYSYSNQDSFGRYAYLYNYDNSFRLPDQPGIWKPTGIDQMPPLLPHWGNVRTFTPEIRGLKIAAPLPYAENQNSELFSQAWELYTLSKSLSLEKKWISEFWSDDFHGVTFCAASRWISIALQAMEKSSPLEIEDRLEMLAKIGIALNDAAVLTWEAKYQYTTERPETYIGRLIEPNWQPLHESPSFPSYPSGHSIFGAAAASVLTNTFGESFKMADYSHDNRKEFLGKPRKFSSFHEMANENALSRMYMGVHYRQDCEEGLRYGFQIGDEVNRLNFRKRDKALKE